LSWEAAGPLSEQDLDVVCSRAADARDPDVVVPVIGMVGGLTAMALNNDQQLKQRIE
jgi:hypothetical protein